MNGRKIVQITEITVNSKKNRILLYQGTGSEVRELQRIIKSILTKEQFEQMKYIVEEEK